LYYLCSYFIIKDISYGKDDKLGEYVKIIRPVKILGSLWIGKEDYYLYHDKARKIYKILSNPIS